MTASTIELSRTQRRDRFAGSRSDVEGEYQRTRFLRIAIENAANGLSSDCPAVKRRTEHCRFGRKPMSSRVQLPACEARLNGEDAADQTQSVNGRRAFSPEH
jgi:hypothetical protein